MIKKLLIIANSEDWNSWNDKINDLKIWSKTIDLEVNIQHTNYAVIPFSSYNGLIDKYNQKFLISGQEFGVDTTWYDTYISSQAKEYDIVLFSVNMQQWRGQSARGWRTDSNFGPVELQVGADEGEGYFNPDGTFINSFLSFAKHEISHALYQISGQPDRTHEFYYDGDPYLTKIWGDIKFPVPNQYVAFESYWMNVYQQIKSIIMPPNNVGDIKIAAFCRAIQNHEGWIENPPSKSVRNNNPGNLRFRGQSLAIGQDKTGFAIFKTYEDGFKTLTQMIKNVCLGLSTIYKPDFTILEFFSKYAPSSDSNDPLRYAQVVAKEIGVDINYKMSDLIK